MIKSMTGYGKAEAALGHKKITVEIRSENVEKASEKEIQIQEPNNIQDKLKE